MTASVEAMLARVNKIRQKAKEQAGEGATEQAPEKKRARGRLPSVPDCVRAVPNGVLRSALFGAVKRGSRRYLQMEKLASIEGVDIIYTGQRLDQADLDVWMCVLQIAKPIELGEQCNFTAYAMLKMLGLTDSGKTRGTLDIRLNRLKAGAVKIRQGRYSYTGSLIDKIVQDEVTKLYCLTLNPDILPLFKSDQYTQIDWDIRRELGDRPLAQWLHGFYSSHANPFPIKVETLHELCGSEAKAIKNFKIDLKKNLDVVSEISAKHRVHFNYSIDGDLVHIDKRKPRRVSKK